MTHRHPIRIVAIVPFPEGTGDEVLAFPDSDGVHLPVGSLQTGERLLDAFARIVEQQAGFRPVAERVLYILEDAEGVLTVGGLCSLPPEIEDTVDLRGEFVSLSRLEGKLEPSALREILLEDVRSGFVRPVAHIVEDSGAGGPELRITW